MSKSRDIADSAATINYIDGLTSDAQTQLDGKATLDASPTFTGTVTATAFSGDGSGLTGVDSLPSQTGNNGLFLTTDGSTASWAEAGGGAWELIASQSIISGTTQYDFTGLSGYRHLRVVGSYTTSGNGSQIQIIMGLSSGASAQNPRDDSYRTALHYYEVSGGHFVSNGPTNGISASQADANKPYFVDCSIMNFNDSSERTSYLFNSVHNQSFNYGSNGGGYIDYVEAYDYLRIILARSDSNTGKIMILGVAG